MIKKQDGSSAIHLIISGDVQGVGYRSWARESARILHLVGWVKNRDDGAVEIVAVGDKADLDTFIARCRKGPDTSMVEHVEIQWSEVAGEFTRFEVIY